MKVKDLIKELQKLDRELIVMISYDDCTTGEVEYYEAVGPEVFKIDGNNSNSNFKFVEIV